jgi:hypothetical protein
MHVPINVKSSNNVSKWQMGFNSAFKELIKHEDFISQETHVRLGFQNDNQASPAA